MKCKFCYATFEDMHVEMLPEKEAEIIILKLRNAGLKKITFAGGEPLLYRSLQNVIKFSKSLGLTTSIITNGSLLTYRWLGEMFPYLDWVGISIDSLDSHTQEKIGRVSQKPVNYYQLIDEINSLGYRLKINTVVNAYNWREDMNDLIRYSKPDRWKVFQALRIEGQNDKQFDEIKVSDEQFLTFISRHSENACLVSESNELMTGSYLLIDPLGRLFENSEGRHTYSRMLQYNAIQDCLDDINLDRDMFIKRGGIYQW